MDTKTAALAALNIPRSTFYYKPRTTEKDEALRQQIEACMSVHKSYGHKRIALDLKRNKKVIRRVMKKFSIKPLRRKKTPVFRRVVGMEASPNLLVSLTPLYQHYVWVTDFTYLWWRGRFVYVATVMDLYTREIVGVSISTSHTAAFVSEALLQALQKAQPTIMHSDQGSEYRSKLFQSILADFDVLSSMSAKGSPWQNGYQESFYSNFKVDLGDPSRWSTFGELVAEIYKAIYYYNHKRIHLALKCAPREFAQRVELNYTENIKNYSV
jgi:transposase InsO family protein